jgi:hypothetical protein
MAAARNNRELLIDPGNLSRMMVSFAAGIAPLNVEIGEAALLALSP